MLFKSVARLAHLSGRPGRRQQFRWGSSKVKGRFYYRFHKPVGKGVWRAYTERYAKPRELEAKQRLVFSCQPTYKQYKKSVSWLWRLPRGLDGATSPNAVLRTFSYFKYKQPKRLYFYLHLLQRLAATGCRSPGDKRLKEFVNKFHAKRKNFLNKPRLALLFAKLRMFKQLDYLGRLIKPGLATYSPSQVTSLAQAYGLARLRDPQLTPAVAASVARLAEDMKTSELLTCAEGFARQEFADQQLWRRLTEVLFARPLTLAESARFLRAMTAVGIVDFAASEVVSVQVRDALTLGRGYSTSLLTGIAQNFARSGVRDCAMIDSILAHAVNFTVDYAPGDLCRLAEVAVGISRDFHPQAVQLLESCDFRLVDEAEALVAAVRAARGCLEASEARTRIFRSCQRRFMKLPVATQRPFELGVLVEMAVEEKLADRKFVERISDHVKFQAEFSEAAELAELAKSLASVEEEAKGSRKLLLRRTLGVWCEKRREELQTAGLWEETEKALRCI